MTSPANAPQGPHHRRQADKTGKDGGRKAGRKVGREKVSKQTCKPKHANLRVKKKTPKLANTQR